MRSYLISISILIVLCPACGHKSKHEKQSVSNIMLLPPPTVAQARKAAADIDYDKKASSNNKAVVDTSQKLVKEGDIRFLAGNLVSTKEKIVATLKSFGGYVADESETNNGDNNQKEFNLKIRVPSKNFDRFLRALSGDADRIDSKNIRVRDVTAEYIDVTSQIKNKKLLEGRYQQLLQRASKMADLLEIENKLTEIRSDIESTQGQLNYLDKQVAYSSLDITFYNKLTAQVADEQFSYRFKTALANGWGILQELFFSIISLWPVVIIGCVAVWLFKIWRKTRKRDPTA
jgi:hypothetical protein